MKKTILSLLCIFCMLLSSCIRMPPEDASFTTDGAEGETSLETTVSDGGLLPALPTYPEWTNATDTAALFLHYPGVVATDHAAYSHDEMMSDLETLAESYPGIFSYHSIGHSLDGREIPVAVLGNPDAPEQVLISAGIHGREFLTPLLVMKQLEFYLAYYTAGRYEGVSYETLFSNTCIYALPMSNPDGIMLSEQGIASVRDPALAEGIAELHAADLAAGRTPYRDLDTYLRYWKANARGVDLNRNYDALWESYRGVSVPSFSNYKGSEPASEPETRALISLTESLSNLTAVICIHSQGEVIYWNCGQSPALSVETKALAERLGERSGYAPTDERINDASFSDWCALQKGLVALTLETGKGVCPLPISQFPSIWEEQFDLFPSLCKS